jgi:hypothetical protein
MKPLLLVLALAALPIDTAAQLISLKTVPVARGEQFNIFPSRNLSMGGVSIALDDYLLDPFVNPAKGGRLAQSEFFSSPTVYTIGENGGAARSLPVGALFGSAGWFGGGIVAMQQIDMGGRGFFQPFFQIDPIVTVPLPPRNAVSDLSSTNKYFQAMVGRKFADGRLALAASAMFADLNAVDGTENLYGGAWSIDQYGHMEDYRLGFTAALPGERTLEAVLVHNRFSMTHDVTFVDWVLTDSTNWYWTPTVRDERNLDKTRSWGAHLGYVQPLRDSNWRIGGILTVNRKQHPKIPNYVLQNIPRDPGHSWAYNIGVGISKQEGPTTFGLDLVYEPAVSHTWQEAEGPTTTANGSIIPDKGKTIENRFNFSNASVNMGLTREVKKFAFQLGLRVKGYDYRLRQRDNVELTSRTQEEQWMEWTPTWGARVTFADLELRYVGRATSGNGFPSINFFGGGRDIALAQSADLVLAPDGPLTLREATVVTHQIAISLPFR